MVCIEVLVRYFAVVREKTGMDEERISVQDGCRVVDLFAELSSRHPILKSLKPHLRVAVNLEFVSDDHRLQAGDEVALIPPVAGGEPRAKLCDEPLDAARLSGAVRRDTDGAVITFVGVVRNHSQGKAVEYLQYEAFEKMALAKLEEIADEIQGKWPKCRILVEHRVGRLQVGDAAIVIAASSPHRKDAFEACQHMIDRIKQIVPIWKREVGPDGASWVGLGS